MQYEIKFSISPWHDRTQLRNIRIRSHQLLGTLRKLVFNFQKILIFDWCEKKLRSFGLILPGASATGKITNVAGAEGGG